MVKHEVHSEKVRFGGLDKRHAFRAGPLASTPEKKVPVRSYLIAATVVMFLSRVVVLADAPAGRAGAASTRDAASCVAIASDIGLTFQANETDHFLVLSSRDDPSASATGRLVDQVYLRFYEQLSRAGFSLKPPQDKLILVRFTSYSALEAYGWKANQTDVSWMDAFYSSSTNRVAVAVAEGRTPEQHMRTITHELTHQLSFNSGLQRRGVTYPLWLTEGLAMNFESGALETVGLEWNDSRFEQRIADITASRRWIPLDQFAGMTSRSVGAGSATLDAYAQSCVFFRYLLERRPQDLKKYMAEMISVWNPQQSPEDLRRRFIAVFGPVRPLEEDFLRYVNKG